MSKHDIHIWLKLHDIKTEKGSSLDFRNHLFLLKPFADLSPNQVIYKAAQIGFSTTAIIKTLWLSYTKNLSVAYTLPTVSDAEEFVGTKVNKIVTANPILKSYVRDGDTMSKKEVGHHGLIFFRGTFLEKQAISISCDLLVHDEVDSSNSGVIEEYESRLQHSAYKWKWYFSHPSFPGAGVGKYWSDSTQQEWFIRCGGCGSRQYLEWPYSIDLERKVFVCKDCDKELTPEERRVGEWVAKYKDRPFVGYHISLLMAPWVTAKEIIEKSENKTKQFFWNKVLGLPYVGEGNTVTPDVIFRNCTQTVNDQEEVIIGCDSGLTKHYVLGNKQGLFHYGKTQTWETIEGYLKRFHRSVAVIDALPDLTEPRKLREKYPGRVYLNYYAKDRKTEKFIRWGKGEEEGNIQTDRNKMMQMVIDEFADGRVPLQGSSEDWQEYYGHWKTLYRTEEKDALGNPWFIWETSTGNDHWCHATLLWRVGMDRFAKQHSSIVTPDSKGMFKYGSPIELDGTHSPYVLPSDRQPFGL